MSLTHSTWDFDRNQMGYGKGNATMERGPRMPMIVNSPGRVQPIGPSGALVSFVDIFATLVDLGDATLPEDYVLDGMSFGPVLDGSKHHVRSWLFSYLADKRMLRDTRWLLDGNGTFFDCGNRRNEQGYKDMTDSTDPEVAAARQRFEKILEDLPGPDPNDPAVTRYHEKKAKKIENRKKTQAAWEAKYGNKK